MWEFDPIKIQEKWQRKWEENKTFKTQNDTSKPKYYCLDMFPYPSWEWLHVGHPKWYTANDIVARYKKTKWFNVLHPMWWDAFWLPAENYAIKTWTHPRITTDKNINNFRKQIKSIGISYDWDREIDTTDPKYYKWTQWIFLKMFEHGLAYEQDLPINYCPSCKTWLANEEVLADHTCDRCWTVVEKRKIRQWVLAITKYAERLINDVDKLDWPEWIKDMQRNWIGKSEGTQFDMNVVDNFNKNLGKISVYTTRIDTVFGMTYAVIAPDHSMVNDFITSDQKQSCDKYIDEAKKKSDQDRTAENKEKTWVFTGSYVINPFNWEKIQLWISDYVLWNYGTWAVMAVPAHDERDYAFAKKYNLPIIQSIKPKVIERNGQWAFREDKPIVERTVIGAIVKHPTENKILVLDRKEFGWKTFVMWGAENWEDPKESIIRELKEETWYTNIKSIEKLPFEIESYFFAAHKDQSRRAFESCYVIELKDLEKDNVQAEELSKHEPIWVETSKVNEIINTAWHIFFANQFVNPSAYTEYGILTNSWEFSGLASESAIVAMQKWLEEKWIWFTKVNYKLRDWLFSRQRYWWEPIPLIHLEIPQVKQLPHITDLSQATDLNLAYILKREPKDNEACDNATCHGMVRELVINWKVFSKIYDWLYGKIVCDYNLPLELPQVEKYEPAGDGQSPLAHVDSFVNIKLADNLTGRRETNTMPQWWWSCWYYLRFMDNLNDDVIVGKDAVDYWWAVDSYVWWAEHAVLHLLYARFWHKFLFDIGVVNYDEPFYRLKNQWLIQAYAYQRKNGWLVANDMVIEKDWKYFHKETNEELNQIVAKMSKSLKNVVNPDDVINQHWSDALRLYEMYMSDFKDWAPWDPNWIVWVKRFLERVWNMFENWKPSQNDEESMKLLHKSIKKLWEDIENYKFNTAIAQLMILLNGGHPVDEQLAKEWKKIYVILLHPFAPHIAEELWEKLWYDFSVFSTAVWPEFDPKLVEDENVNLAVQFNWKVRWTILISKKLTEIEVLNIIKTDDKLGKYIQSDIKKTIFVPWKIINIIL